MRIEYIKTDVVDETTVDWYRIDGVVYGATRDGKILESDGNVIVNDSNARWAIERFQWARLQDARFSV